MRNCRTPTPFCVMCLSVGLAASAASAGALLSKLYPPAATPTAVTLAATAAITFFVGVLLSKKTEKEKIEVSNNNAGLTPNISGKEKGIESGSDIETGPHPDSLKLYHQ